jgi:bifunctional DNA-binding transcriptional regulator/antitoxin component of YhaV-PrlF toxin-antitoxin module
VVPAVIRKRFRLGPSTRLEWIVESDGSIRVVPVEVNPVQAFRGSGVGGSTGRLLADRRQDRQQEH